MLKKITRLLYILPLIPTLSYAASDADLQKLQRDIRQLQNKVSKLQKSDETTLKLPANFSDAKFFGRLQVDRTWFDDDGVDRADNTDLRRARLGVSGKVEQDWVYKFEIDFANNATKLTDAYMSYHGFDNVDIKVGQYKEPFSLQVLESSKYVTFLESAAIRNFAPERNIGLGAKTYGEDWTLEAGIFGDDAGSSSTDDEQHSFTSRVTYAPIKEKGKVIHLGVVARYSSPQSSTVTYSSKFEANQEDSNTPSNALTTGALSDVNKIQQHGLEAMAIYKSLYVQGEYITTQVKRKAADNPEFDGYYLQATYFLTGESREYDFKKGIPKRVIPNAKFSKSGSGIGAWEVAARLSDIDLTGTGVNGGSMRSYTAGLNWHPISRVRFMANYTITDVDNNGQTPADESPKIFGLRAQIDF
jgi:phosphate-selective porin OprO/OprP